LTSDSYRRNLRLSTKRILREPGWSAGIFAILVAGLTIWILIPSAATSLQSNLGTYASGAAAYVVVVPGHYCPIASLTCPKALPEGAVKNISAIQGVEHVYHVILNETWFYGPTLTHGHFTAVLGGTEGFPVELLSLESGRLAADGPEFLYGNYDQLLLSTVRNGSSQVAIGCYGCPNSISGPFTLSPRFNATGIGEIGLNPLFGDVGVMWNSTYLMHEMGSLNYSRTFGGSEPNYLIIRVSDIADLPRVANVTATIIKPYTWFSVRYDQALAQSLQSFTSQTGPLYQTLGAVSLAAVTGIAYLTARVIAGRRDWEGGLLLTQGLKWSDVQLFYSYYFLILGLAAFAAATIVSFEVSRLFTATYRLFYGQVTIQASIVPTYVAGALIFVILLAFFSAYMMVRRLRKMGLDTILREY
jgi:FtsX-like permease family